MLPAANRLRRQSDFQRLFRGGRTVRGKFLILRIARTARTTRAGFVVSTAVSKAAVDRNRLKRQLRAAAREIGLPAHSDLAVIAMKSALHQPYPAIIHDLRTLFHLADRPAPRR